ncbi:MAG: hypothetical protein WC878_04245 [Candidatus Paceibacterota bacterium]|jgi:hypothetical protein
MERDVLIYHKVLLFLSVRKMLGIPTEESCLYGFIKANPEEIAKAVDFLVKGDYMAKVIVKNETHCELTEKGIESASVGIADLLGKAIIWFQ